MSCKSNDIILIKKIFNYMFFFTIFVSKILKRIFYGQEQTGDQPQRVSP